MAIQRRNSFGARATLRVVGGEVDCFRLDALERAGVGGIDRLPFSIRVLLENQLRSEDGERITADDVLALARWQARAETRREVGFMPARVLLQDFTGVPAVVDLAAMRDGMRRLGGDPKRINPEIPVDLVIDHSVQVDEFGTAGALAANGAKEFERNRERYEFLRWGQQSFRNFRVVPPDTGICHQVNLEYLARVVFESEEGGRRLAFPDTVVGTDSHTTMVNGIGVLGWGVGGIEAEAVMLGQPYAMLAPDVVGFELTGVLAPGATATDLVLTVTEMLRRRGVVGKFVEFHGGGLEQLAPADRATVANMAPEYGATMGFFPVDDRTLDYLRLSGRSAEQVALVEAYCKEQGIFRTASTRTPEFSDHLKLDLATVEPSLAGPKRPQDRVPLSQMKRVFFDALQSAYKRAVETAPAGVLTGDDAAPVARRHDLYERQAVNVVRGGSSFQLTHGSVLIAAITSCTNTSNPSVMLGAGLLARNAVARGLRVRPWVKTSLAPGSKVVTGYLKEAGLLGDLEKLGFHVVGYGCTTCIGNSGPLAADVSQTVKQNDLVVAAVLSGNRNFEGRVHPLTLANYLASPPLVVAYALAGTVDIDMRREPLGEGSDGKPVYLRDIWPPADEVRATLSRTVRGELFAAEYADVFRGGAEWRAIGVPEGEIYRWSDSTYIKEPPFFTSIEPEVPPLADIRAARVLALLGDSVTTDHISPAGSIPVDGPAGKYLIEQGVSQADFNSFGARRGNHEVMMRGTFGNIRLRNQLVPGAEGNWTRHLPSGERMSIFDAALRYAAEAVPLIVIAGKEYGTGSSRDWAAKGTRLLGVRAVIAESFERIHRSNLVGMGVLPLEFEKGESRETVGLTGEETFDIAGIAAGLEPQKRISVRAERPGGGRLEFAVVARIDSHVEAGYFQNGGILQSVLRSMAAGARA